MDQQRLEGFGHGPERLAEWDLLVADAIHEAERRLADEKARERKRAIQLAREQGYHRLAMEIDRPRRSRRVSPSQLSFFPERNPTLFEDDGSDS
jgi:hypothetical protein